MVRKAKIAGRLDLSGMDIPFPLRFEACEFTEPPLFDGMGTVVGARVLLRPPRPECLARCTPCPTTPSASRHAHLARTLGGAATYEPDVATFSSLTGDAWTDLAKPPGPRVFAGMFSLPVAPARLVGANTSAFARYGRPGFETRKPVTFQGFRTP